MPPKIYVQRINVYWTKASRGAPGSAVRNALPEAYAIAPDALDLLQREEGYSQVILREWEGFRPNLTVERFGRMGRYRWPSLSVKFQDSHRVTVHYKFNHLVEGAPDRSHRPAIDHELSTDQLLRVKYNSRDARPTGEWIYELTVFNIVWTEHPSVSMFLAEPAKRIDDLADLW